MKTIMYIILGILLICLVSIKVYSYLKTGDTGNITNITEVVAYNQVFTPTKGSKMSFPDFLLEFRGMTNPSIIERLSFQSKKHLDGPLLAGYFNFTVSPLPNVSIADFENKRLKIEDVPWGGADFVQSGKTYTLKNSFEVGNQGLPRFVVTEKDIETSEEIKERMKNVIPIAGIPGRTFAKLHYIDLNVGKSKYPDREFFKPNTKETDDVLTVLATELLKNGYTPSDKRNVQLIGYTEGGKKRVYAFMWVVGSPLDRHDPEQNYLTNMISDGGSSFIDAVVNIDPMSDFHSVFIVSFDPHGES